MAKITFRGVCNSYHEDGRDLGWQFAACMVHANMILRDFRRLYSWLVKDVQNVMKFVYLYDKSVAARVDVSGFAITRELIGAWRYDVLCDSNNYI